MASDTVTSAPFYDEPTLCTVYRLDATHQVTNSFSWKHPSAKTSAMLLDLSTDQRLVLARTLWAVAPDLKLVIADESNPIFSYDYYACLEPILTSDGHEGLPAWFFAGIMEKGETAAANEVRNTVYSTAARLLRQKHAENDADLPTEPRLVGSKRMILLVVEDMVKLVFVDGGRFTGFKACLQSKRQRTDGAGVDAAPDGPVSAPDVGSGAGGGGSTRRRTYKCHKCGAAEKKGCGCNRAAK